MKTNHSPVDAYHIPGAGIVALDCNRTWCIKTRVPHSGCMYFDGPMDGAMGERGGIKVLCKRGPYETGAEPTCTCGDYATEKEAEAHFDAVVERSGLFAVHRQAVGRFILEHPEKVMKQRPRIDRLLLPTEKAIAQGWDRGCVGVEIKRSGEALGPPLNQLLDYMACLWRTPDNAEVRLSYGFLFPLGKCGYALGSLMSGQRFGGCWLRYAPTSEFYQLAFFCGEQSRFTLYLNTGQIEIRNQSFGKKTGSR